MFGTVGAETTAISLDDISPVGTKDCSTGRRTTRDTKSTLFVMSVKLSIKCGRPVGPVRESLKTTTRERGQDEFSRGGTSTVDPMYRKRGGNRRTGIITVKKSIDRNVVLTERGITVSGVTTHNRKERSIGTEESRMRPE
jgi:hypothetical protein